MRQERILLVTVLLACVGVGVQADMFEENIFFNYYNSTRDVIHAYNFAENNSYPYDETCNPEGKFAIVVFGWKVTCEKYFVQDLIGNLTKHRGGCVICMSYDKFSQAPYLRLRRYNKEIQGILKRKLDYLEQQGFDPDNGYVYGFSFGAHLVLGAARDFGAKKLREVDVCEIVGLNFDATARSTPNYRLVAKNVQCIHTSKQYGTKFHSSCHQDWFLGDCGEKQDAAPLSPYGSHGVCTLFYNSAFDHDFLAVPNTNNCTADQEAENWPEGFKMGYTETRKTQVRGQLFANTYAAFPFNIPAPNASDSQTTLSPLRSLLDFPEYQDFEDLAND